jgi:hypothetical protein
MKLATLTGALVLTAVLVAAAPSRAEASYWVRPYVSAYYGPSYYGYGYYRPYRHYHYYRPYVYRRAYVPYYRPYYYHRPRFHFGIWW